MSDLAADAGKPPQQQQQSSQAKPPAPAETRLNANAKSFTPTATTVVAAGAAAPAHPPAKQPPPTRHAGAKTPPAGAGTKGSPASGAQTLAPPAPHLPPAQSAGKKGMMMMPPPPRFPEMAGMVPGMPPPMPGTASTGGMMPAGFMPPPPPPPPPPPMMMPPPNGMMFQQSGTPGMPHHHHHPAGMATPQQHLASQHQHHQQHGMMPMWVPPPPTQTQQHQQQQQPGMMMPMNSMMPMPMPMSMPMGAASSPMPPGQRSSGPQQHPPQQPGMMMPFYPPPQAPHGTMPPMASIPPPAPGMGVPRAPTLTAGAAPGGAMIPPQAAGAAATAAMMAPSPHHSYMHPHPGSSTASSANASAAASSISNARSIHSNTQNHINTGMQATASRPASISMPSQPPPPMMMMNHTGSAMMPPPPPPPPPPPTVAANARVSVGNATLAALNSKEPPKFSCVLLSGIPAVGKTTLGRELVNSLKTDGMGWAFFSGADFLTEQQGKRSIWETTKDVFDALSSRLDELLEKQHKDRNIKGLVIDKNCKGIEDVYYLSALLLSKSIPFVGIVGMECAEDDVLVKRMGGDDYLKEKLKFHRVIHARIVSLAKSAGMYRYVDATKSKEEVVQMLRTMVLGCCAQPPTRSIGNHQYDDSRANIMVDDYKEYSEVLTHLFRCVNNRGSQFPGNTDLVPFSEKEMKDKGRINAIKSRYGIRRKVDGHRYLLVYREKKLYLVPPHMRAVLQMPLKAWLGSRLDSDSVGTFVLEGDLTRLIRDRQKELFLVYDAHYWSEAEQPSSNKMIRMTFSERQAFLAANMCSESKAFFAQDGVECVVVHQPTQKMSEAVDMLDSEEYPSDGLVFQAVNPIHRSDHVFVWQQPSCMTVDFRVGQLLDTRQPPETDTDGIPTSMKGTTSDLRRNASGTVSPQQQQLPLTTRRGNVDAFSDHPIRTFMLEVYDKTEKMYVQYENATVDVRHPDVVEGCIVTCSLVDDTPRRWVFRRIRYDVLRPIYKLDLEELLGSCLIPRAKLVAWMLSEQIVPSEIQPDGNGSGAGGSGSAINVPNVPPPSYDAAAAAVAAANAKGAAASMGMMQGLAMPLPTQGMMPPLMNDIGSPPAFHASAAATAIPMAPTAPARCIYPSASAMLSRVATVPTNPAPPPAVPAPRPPAQMSTEAQLKQLASIVPSFHVVDGSKEGGAAAVAVAAASSTPAAAGSNGTAAGLAGKSAAPRAMGGAASDGNRNCAQCHKPKQSEDLRVDRRDHRHYCYSCWAKSGYGFCAVCGEFKEVRRESKGRQKGSTVCAPCGKAAAAAATAPADAASSNASPAAATTAAVVVKTAASAPTTPAASAAAQEAAEAKVDVVLPSAKARKKAAAKAKKAVGVPPATGEATPSTGSAAPAEAAAKTTGGEGGKAVKGTGGGSSRAVAESAPSSPTTGKGGDTAHGGKKKDSVKVSSSSLDASMSASPPDAAAAEAALSQAPKSEKPSKSVPIHADAAPAPAAPAVAVAEAPAAKPVDSKVAEPPEEAVAAPAAPTTSTAVQDPSRAQVHEEKRSVGGCRQQ
ncbi:conserved_protein [Leishmania infantum]|uniref:Conserved_protein n=2 Tax=Leishmania infantum TaxID=5671 RepID=A0A6L0WP09_LEIIN|nr:conserved_protein [Leishmania infantum]SUZ38586.1 conserved_protein [Leishmania infantum]